MHPRNKLIRMQRFDFLVCQLIKLKDYEKFQLPVVRQEYECHAIRLIEDEDQDYAHHADQFFARNLSRDLGISAGFTTRHSIPKPVSCHCIQKPNLPAS